MNIKGFLLDLLGIADTFGDVWHGDLDEAMLEHGLLVLTGRKDENGWSEAVPSNELRELLGGDPCMDGWVTHISSREIEQHKRIAELEADQLETDRHAWDRDPYARGPRP